MEPFTLALDFESGRLEPATSHLRRTISDMAGSYLDAEAETDLVNAGDPLIYEVLQYDMPEENGQLVVCTTVVQPGKVGDEYFMTKGHYHAKRATGEVYLGLRGQGKLLLEADGEFTERDLKPGVVAYVPPHWAHRTANTGPDPLIFFAVYPADAGHDYAAIERTGFRFRLLDRAGVPELVASDS